MKILLICNYLLDRQAAMQKFVSVLYKNLISKGYQVRIIRPNVILGRFGGLSENFKKWFGYIDKFILFPATLYKIKGWADIIHICDHSNSIYINCIKDKPNLLTCHDVLAIRGGLGEETDCPASITGKILQRWILNGLRQAKAIACISDSTRKDLLRLLNFKTSSHIQTVLFGLMYPYTVIEEEETLRRLAAIPNLNIEKPYVLHVGSDLRRKNREAVIRIFNSIKNNWDGSLVFAGEGLGNNKVETIRKLGLAGRVVQIAEPSDRMLEALYNRAFALLFPSRFEGFGIPIIEAQACGCPILCSSDCGPFPEIVRDSAITFPFADEKSFSDAVLRLQDPTYRDIWVRKGLENVKRFTTEIMVSKYFDLYDKLLEER
jgi:glycosyltransferase involved in cell wall biosynthesis